MMVQKPVMGWNSWNTFAENINEKLIMETADAMIESGYLDAGYEYVIIDDCWSLKERVDGKLVANPELFPHGIKYVSDYVHSKGLKFGMYSCAGVMTCAGYPSSYGYEFEDAKQFADWGVDYLKYDFCNFPASANCKNAYLTMAMALRNCGRDIVFAACNWGVEDPSKWMRSHGAHTYRSTGDIMDNATSFKDIFKSQMENIENSAPGCYNDMDMLTVGMHGNGHVGLGGCTSDEYKMHFAMWAFMGSPLIIGGDIRSLNAEDKATLQNKYMISINQDSECRPPFVVKKDFNDNVIRMIRLLDNGKFAYAIFNLGEASKWAQKVSVMFDDAGIHSNTKRKIKVTDASDGKTIGSFYDGFTTIVKDNEFAMFICEIAK